MLKAGTRTTEFYKSLATMVIGGAVGLGIIQPSTVADAGSQIAPILESVTQIVGFVVAAAANISYNASRGMAKSGGQNEEGQ